MKTIILCTISSLFILPVAAQACPNLTGEYYCLFADARPEPYLDVLKIRQTTDANDPGVTTFISGYRSIPGYEDVYRADNTGIADGMGWINKCRADRIVSVRDDFSAYAELYLDKDDKLVRTYNYQVQQTCTRKK